MLTSRLELCRYFLNLDSNPSIKSILKEDVFSLTDLEWITLLRNCYLRNTTSHMIQGLSCLVAFLFQYQKHEANVLLYNAVKMWNNAVMN